MGNNECRQLVPSSWTWIFIAIMICLAVKAMHNKTSKGDYFPTAKVASIFSFMRK